MDKLTIPFLGGDTARWQYPFGDLQRCGARLAAGSGRPVSSPDPLQGIHTAVNRRCSGRPSTTTDTCGHAHPRPNLRAQPPGAAVLRSPEAVR